VIKIRIVPNNNKKASEVMLASAREIINTLGCYQKLLVHFVKLVIDSYYRLTDERKNSI